jgi:hypothetical protein
MMREGSVVGLTKAGVRAGSTRASLQRLVNLGWLTSEGADEVAALIDTVEDLVAAGALSRAQADGIIQRMAEDKVDEWIESLRAAGWAEMAIA